MDFALWLLIGSGGLVFVLALLFPLLSYLYTQAADSLDEHWASFSEHWVLKSAWQRQWRSSRQQQRAFARWFSSNVSGTGLGGLEEDLLAAQKLTPTIRQLLEEEIPQCVRRCNVVHRRMATLVRATLMREVAAEPECLAARQWTVLLLQQTAEIFDQYPLALKLDSEELLDAAIVVRRNLLPNCVRCPYIRQTVSEAGVLCPASRLIGLDPPC